MNLDKIYNPKSIAIIGASAQKGSVGNALFVNALASKVKRKIYPVNINGKKILGQKTYSNVKEINKEIDLAVIATPAFTVPSVVEDCINAKVKGIIIISSGFSEVGASGKKLVDNILEMARKSGVRVMGPNCLGFINPTVDLNMSFASKQALKGRTALVSQSGALCTAILDWSLAHNIGFSNFISIGSMIDIGFADLIEYLGQDKNTDNIVLYMESLNEPAKFIKACQNLPKNKRVFVLKSGRSQAGASAAKSHTGSLAGNDQAFDALFRQAGVSRLDSIQDLYDITKISSFGKINIGKRLAIITNAGGPGVLSTDCLYRLGGGLARLSSTSVKQLNERLPASWSKSNPVDIIGDADPIRYRDALTVCLNDKNIDSVLVVLTPQAMTDSLSVAKEIVKLTKTKNKFVFTSFMGSDDIREARAYLYKNKISFFDTPERAIAAFVKISEIKNNVKNGTEISIEIESGYKQIIRNIFVLAKIEKRKQLTEAEAKTIFSYYDVPVLPFATAISESEVRQKSGDLKFPIAMKILSPDIMHKIDCGGVELNILNQDDAVKKYAKIIKSVKTLHPNAKIEGIFMEPMVASEIELIIGLSYDPVLGPILMFGRGGTEVELYKDIAFGILPMNKSEILLMMKETKVFERLKGYRNTAGVDIDKLIDVVFAITQLSVDFPEIKELDVNPLAFSGGRMFVLDGKLVLN